MNNDMLFYMIPKIANWKENNEDVCIAINYNKQDDEKNLSGLALSKHKRFFIAKQLKIPPLFLVPITQEEYLKSK